MRQKISERTVGKRIFSAPQILLSTGFKLLLQEYSISGSAQRAAAKTFKSSSPRDVCSDDWQSRTNECLQNVFQFGNLPAGCLSNTSRSRQPRFIHRDDAALENRGDQILFASEMIVDGREVHFAFVVMFRMKNAVRPCSPNNSSAPYIKNS